MPEMILGTVSGFLGSWLGVMARLSLYGVLLLGVVLLAEGVFRRRALTLLHTLWTLVVLRLLLPPGLAFRWSFPGMLLPWLHARSMPRVEISSTLMASSPMTGPPPTFSWWQLGLFLFWLLGAVFMVATLWRHWRRSRAVLREGMRLDDRRTLELLGVWRRRYRVRRRVGVVLAARGATPFTMGLFRPTIVLPAEAAASWTVAHLEAVLAHELAHIARLDILWLRLENLVQVLFFFHPAAWIAPSRLGRLRELLCDRLVLSGAWLDPAVYARSLLDSLRPAPAGVPALQPAGPALAETKEGLTMRLHALKQPVRGFSPRLTATLFTLILLGGLLLPMAPASAGPQPDAFDDAVRYTKDSGLTEPRRIEAPQPAYPEEARKQRIQGTVVLVALIGTDGAVHDVRVLRPMPGGLSEAAEEAVRRWKFEPARNEKGQAVPVRYVLTVRFRLAGAKSGPATTSTHLPRGATAPVPVSHPSPVYPEAARRKRIQGAVVLKLNVGADGTVRQVGVVRGLPEGLSEAAVQAFRNWKFKPAIDPDGKPIPAQVFETVRFVLDHAGTPPDAAPPTAGQ